MYNDMLLLLDIVMPPLQSYTYIHTYLTPRRGYSIAHLRTCAPIQSSLTTSRPTIRRTRVEIFPIGCHAPLHPA